MSNDDDDSDSDYNVIDDQSLSASDSQQPNDTTALSASSAGTARKRKRRLPPAASPFKRQRAIFNADYLDLLNHDIDDAANRACLDDDFDLPPNQVGLTSWSSLEKQLFFEALARLGRHDLPGIASRVGTKSVIEIRHYLHYLKEADAIRNQQAGDSFLEVAEYPAAVELSQQCCHALEQAADAISLRQENEEMKREAKKWGDCWNVTPDIAEQLVVGDDEDPSDAQPPPAFAQLFDLPRWLQLSEQVLMNSSVPGDNWHSVGSDTPSIWATALDDFYSLAVSLTRRLVQTTLFISMSRIRSKKRIVPRTRDIVRRRDVEAAVKSLGLTPNTWHFWLTSARRLRLRVCRQLPATRNDGAEEEPMTFDELEAELGAEQDDQDTAGTQATIQPDDSSTSEDDEQLPDVSVKDEPLSSDQEQQEIAREANEVLWYTAADLRDVERARRPLERRIAMERRQEEQAQEWDAYASYQAELSMWSMLRETPPQDMPKAQEPAQLERSKLDVEGMYSGGGDWTSHLTFRDEWEAAEDRDR
ncbi:hypothetical protein L249_4080 [Ophiocordyceps polyrhachis-furcata BCC 54312]|uniref:Myb-like domain-containing protein n=1 Tax=Ophiocordyceps polyrhachis-furcata BCC 54312 TaxID=1330021 RepID=A0A367L4Z8_9HYPO|nr:hypothetical protein L249_4080 [Ophiocordyceps polyrhachis-furcata BCC 54312]